MRRCIALTLVLAFAGARAQAQTAIDPGMSKAQVVAKFGTPYAERAAGSSTYLFYKNGVEKRAGMNDIVILESDKVVDAVLRSKDRSYSGKSSSPREIPASTARAAGRENAAAKHDAPAKKTAAPSAEPASAPVKGKVLPAEKAQQEDVVHPMPPAGSGQRAAQKAADDAAAKKTADDAAKKAAADANKKPDPTPAAPTKKP